MAVWGQAARFPNPRISARVQCTERGEELGILLGVDVVGDHCPSCSRCRRPPAERSAPELFWPEPTARHADTQFSSWRSLQTVDGLVVVRAWVQAAADV